MLNESIHPTGFTDRPAVVGHIYDPVIGHLKGQVTCRSGHVPVIIRRYYCVHACIIGRHVGKRIIAIRVILDSLVKHGLRELLG